MKEAGPQKGTPHLGYLDLTQLSIGVDEPIATIFPEEEEKEEIASGWAVAVAPL